MSSNSAMYLKKVVYVLLALFAPAIPISYVVMPYIISCDRHGSWVVVPIVLLLLVVLGCYMRLVSKFCETDYSKNIKILFIIVYGLYCLSIAYLSMFAGALSAMSYCYEQTHKN